MGTIAKMGSDLAWNVKEKGNWQISRWSKDKIDNLARLVYNHNTAHQDSKASQKAIFRTIASKWGIKRAIGIYQYNPSEKYPKKVRQVCLR